MNVIHRISLIFIVLVFSVITYAQKPKVWIYTDMSNPELEGNNHMGTINDPDDVSAMGAYLLMANMFDTRGIVVASTHRHEHASTPNQADWANNFFGSAYQEDVVLLNQHIGGYPEEIIFEQSSIKSSAERFDPTSNYLSIKHYTTIQRLVEELEESDEIINVLCWGSLTEPAILVKHCITTNRFDLLNKMRFIAHWTNSPWRQGSMEHPEDVANCREDADACAYLKYVALNGHVAYYECGAVGQHGIVSGSPKGDDYYLQFKRSKLGKIFAEGKYVHSAVDDSDAATYWTLIGNWGVSLNDITSNGTNNPDVEKRNEAEFFEWAPHIRAELLRRSNIAAGF